jgi:hypothetical protein
MRHDDDAQDDDPKIMLLTGEAVSRVVFELVRRLQATGHTITIGSDTVVSVRPPVWEDLWHLLDSHWKDVEYVLDADHQDPAARWTVPAATVH